VGTLSSYGHVAAVAEDGLCSYILYVQTPFACSRSLALDLQRQAALLQRAYRL